MGRKVNSVGTGTLTLSLPRDWVLKHGIKKGDELDVISKDNSLVIRTSKIKESGSKKVFRSEGIDAGFERILAGFYKAGYAEIELFYSSPKDIDKLQNLLQKTFIGYEIVDITKKRVIIKQVSNILVKELNDMYRRLWLVFVGIGEETYLSLKDFDIDSIKSTIKRHELINRYADFCRRALNTSPADFARPGPFYSIIELIEKTSYQYVQLLQVVRSSKKRPSEEVISQIKAANGYLQLLRSAVFDYNHKKIDQFIRKKGSLDDMFSKANILKKDDMLLSFHCRQIVQLLFFFNSSVTSLNA